MDERIWRLVQRRLGYTDREMATFRDNPRNADILSKSSTLMNTAIVAEVVESHGCNSRHRVGDKFHFDGAGNLITGQCPSKVCVYALSAVATLVFAANELIYAGVDPNEMRFNRVGCIDVGLQCGGWGRVVMEIKAEDRQKGRQ
jgi:uncharacterized repeat protein (TIGR04076 family)